MKLSFKKQSNGSYTFNGGRVYQIENGCWKVEFFGAVGNINSGSWEPWKLSKAKKYAVVMHKYATGKIAL